MKHYVTHIFDTDLPNDGYKKLSFISITDEATAIAEYYLGTDNNPLEQDDLDNWIRQKKLFRISKAQEVGDNQSLYVDKNGHLFLGNYQDATKNQQKLPFGLIEFTQKAANKKLRDKLPISDLPVLEKYYDTFYV